ncbi:MAG: hypothetical protein Q8W44_05435 [Candidatus Palauibacterales bacterium]|nr:hypothetical protein [Candidatus Palauibacterales bacterium]
MEAEPGRPVYRGTADVDLASGSVEARWTIRFVADSSRRERATFLLNRGVEVTRLTGSAVDTFRLRHFEQAPQFRRLTVDLDDVVEPGSTVVLNIAYGGQLRIPDGGINRIDSSWVELGADAGWHPLFLPLNRELRADVRVGLPDGWSVVASGSVSAVDEGYRIRNTLGLPDIAFAASPAMDTASADRFTVYHRGADSLRVRRSLAAASWAASYLNRRFGRRDSLTSAKLVIAPRDGPSYARKNYLVSALGSELPSERELIRHYCHELSHFWSTDAEPASPHNWLNESFAELVAGNCVRERHGAAAYDSVLTDWRSGAEGLPPVWTPGESGRPPARVSYDKGPLLLHRLEGRVGEETFDRFVTRYMVRRVETTPELLSILEEVAGEDARMWLVEALAEGRRDTGGGTDG